MSNYEWKENILKLCNNQQHGDKFYLQQGGATATQEHTVALQQDINKATQDLRSDISDLKRDKVDNTNLNLRLDGLTRKVQAEVMQEVDKTYLKISDAPDQGKLDEWRNSLTQNITDSREIQTKYEAEVNKYIAETRILTDTLAEEDRKLKAQDEQVTRRLAELNRKDQEVTSKLVELRQKDEQVTTLLTQLRGKGY